MALELTNNNERIEIRILKEASCSSLFERTTLTYQIGCTDRNDIMFRITSDNGARLVNQKIFSSGDMLELIYESKKPFSWKVLYPLMHGKSANTACFLMAVLKNEDLLKPLDRLYEQKSSAQFQDRMKILVAKNTSPTKN